MHNNILIIKSSQPLEISREFNEPKHLTFLFKGKSYLKMNSSGTLHYIFDVDSSLISKSDAIWQKFRADASYDASWDRKKLLERTTFEKWYFERKAI